MLLEDVVLESFLDILYFIQLQLALPTFRRNQKLITDTPNIKHNKIFAASIRLLLFDIQRYRNKKESSRPSSIHVTPKQLNKS
jgi:hypothetical protein